MHNKIIQVTEVMTIEQFKEELIGLLYGPGEELKIFERIVKPSSCEIHYNENDRIIAWLFKGQE